MTRLKNAALALSPSHAAQIVGWRIKGATPRYERLAADPDGNVLLLNFVDAFTLLNGVPFSTAILETHDVKFLKFARLAKQPVFHGRVLGKLRSELALLTQADALVAIAGPDAALFRGLAPEVPTFYVPSYGPGGALPLSGPDAGSEYDLLFVGADNAFNAEGLAAYLQENRGWLARRRIAVAGKVSQNPRIAALAPEWPSLSLLGFVDDLAALYRRSKAVLSPVDGTGLKIKVVEALANGRPVFASPHSRDALPPGYEGCVFPMDRAAVEGLLQDPHRLAAASAKAFAYHCGFIAAGERDAFQAFLQERLSPAAAAQGPRRLLAEAEKGR